MSPDSAQLLREINRKLRLLVIATCVLWVAVVAVSIGVLFVTIKVNSESSETKASLCTFRTDLQTRLDATRDILDKNPNAFDGLGIPKAVITQNIRNQQRTVDALRGLDCP